MYQEVGNLMRAIEVVRTQQSECSKCNFQRSKNKAFRKPKRSFKSKNANKSSLRLQESEKIIDETYALLGVNILDKSGIITGKHKATNDYKPKPRNKKNLCKNTEISTTTTTPNLKVLPWIMRWKNRKVHPVDISSQVISKLQNVRPTMNLLQEKSFVNGDWVSSASGKTFNVTNPANGNVIASVPDMNVEDIESAVKAAAEAFKTWQLKTAKERAHILRQWYNLLEANHENIAEIMTAESGKPLAESRAEVTYGNSFIEWFSEEARRIQGEIIQSPTPTKQIMVVKQPIGVAALITPWNFPHAMITRKAGAALASGCTCVVKPAEDTPLTALAVAQLGHEAGLPKGVFNVITSDRGNAGAIGKFLCESPLVAGLSFTGSTAVGKLLYRQCASGIKRLGLELGGNAPFIVFKSANIEKATKGALASKFRNCGQTCVSANRFLVQDEVYDSFVKSFIEHIKDIKMGEGTQPGVTTGPLINHAQFQKVSDIVQDALDKGAKALTGGKPASSLGKLFYEPTLLVDVKENMRVYQEEVFGPVATIIRFKTEEEGLQIANATERGLAAYFFTEDVSQMFRVSQALEVGMIGINEGIISTAEAPFGGVKESGLGREGSHHGIEDYTYIKYICVGNV